MRTPHKLIGQEIRKICELDENIKKALGHSAILRQARENLDKSDGRHPAVAREEFRLAKLPFTPIHSSKHDPTLGPTTAPPETQISPEG